MIDSVITCLWKGPDYNPDYVDKLARGVRRNLAHPVRFVCLVDDDYPFTEDIESIPFLAQPKHGSHGWHSKHEIYRPELRLGRTLFLDLDTVITGDLSPIESTGPEIMVPLDPYHAPRCCNGVMMFDEEQAAWLMEQHLAARGLNDMQLVRHAYRTHPERFATFDLRAPELVRSYKVHVQGHAPGDARIVYFHGKPRPAKCAGIPWMQECWR